MNLVLSIFALALALSLAVLVATWCTVLSVLREGLAEEDEEFPLLSEPELDGDERLEEQVDEQLAVTTPCGKPGRI